MLDQYPSWPQNLKHAENRKKVPMPRCLLSRSKLKSCVCRNIFLSNWVDLELNYLSIDIHPEMNACLIMPARISSESFASACSGRMWAAMETKLVSLLNQFVNMYQPQEIFILKFPSPKQQKSSAVQISASGDSSVFFQTRQGELSAWRTSQPCVVSSANAYDSGYKNGITHAVTWMPSMRTARASSLHSSLSCRCRRYHGRELVERPMLIDEFAMSIPMTG